MMKRCEGAIAFSVTTLSSWAAMWREHVRTGFHDQSKLVTLDEHHQALPFTCLPSVALVTTGFIVNMSIFNTNTLHLEALVELIFENCTNGN